MPVVRRRTTRRRRRVGIDTETTGLNVWTGARPFAVSACFEDGEERYWEWDVDFETRKPIIPRRELDEVRELCEDPYLEKDFFNLKFDYFMLESIGVKLDIATCHEVSFMARAVNNLEYAYSLKPLAKKYVEIDDDDEASLREAVVRSRRLAKKLGLPHWPDEDIEALYWMPRSISRLKKSEAAAAGIDPKANETYARRDGERTVVLGAFYRAGMDELGVWKQYRDEMELLPTTMKMERRGVAIYPEDVARVRAQCEAKLKAANEVLVRESGNPDFNINSTKQLAGLLFGPESVAGLPVLERTNTGQPRTNAEALAPHKHEPIVKAVFEARANGQGLKLFFDKYKRLADPSAGPGLPMILHPGYRQCGTLTNRYSCSEPNLQQVSDPDTSNSLAAEFMVDVRQVFGPRPGYVWYCPDYSQVEVIIFADVSGEPALIDAIMRGDDIHGVTAEKIWGGEDNPRALLAAQELLGVRDAHRAREFMEQHGWSIGAAEKSLDKKIFRKKAKSVTFTKVFGGGPTALMRWIQVPYSDAVTILAAYDDTFPTMVERMREIENRGRRDGFVVNPFGRRLAVDRWNAYRAVNHVVQSSAADLMKMGMRSCARYLDGLGLDAHIAMTIHDELIFEFKIGHAYKHVLRGLCGRMADHGGVFKVPTPVTMEKVVYRWSQKEKVAL